MRLHTEELCGTDAADFQYERARHREQSRLEYFGCEGAGTEYGSVLFDKTFKNRLVLKLHYGVHRRKRKTL